MFYITSFLFLILSPGLRGISFVYYPALLLTLFSVIYMILRDPTVKISFRKSASFPYKIIYIIYACLFFSILQLDFAVTLNELLISILRLCLAVIFVSSAIIFPRQLFFRSLLLAIFVSANLAAATLYLQAILGISFDFLSAESATRALLTRYPSTMGSLTAASIGLPLCSFSYTFLLHFLFVSGSKLSSIENKFYSVPSTIIIAFWLCSTVLTLSRTALFTSAIVVFIIYLLPFFLDNRRLSFSFASFRLQKSKLLVILFTGLIGAAILSRFSSFIDVAIGFINPESSEILVNSGVNTIFEDFNERLSMFDDGAFEFRRLLIGDGYHHVSGPLGIVSAGKFSHNTFVDLFHVFGILGPFLVLLLLIFHILQAYRSWCKRSSSASIMISSANLGFVLMMTPTLLTTSGVFYVPLLMLPIFVLYYINSYSYNLKNS